MWLEAYTVSSLTRGSMQTYRRRRSLNQSKRVFLVFVRILRLSRVRVWRSRARVCLACAWLSHSRRKVVRLFQKWYGFLESGTTFLRISHIRQRVWLSRHSLSLIRHGVRLSRARVRVPATASRVTNSEIIFHLHRQGRECRVQRLSALLHS